MKINEILTESQIDEISLPKMIGGVAKGLGAIPGGAIGAIDAAKQGFDAGYRAVSGRGYGRSYGSPSPQSSPDTKINKQQIDQLDQTISSMNVKDLRKLQNTINNTIQRKSRPRNRAANTTQQSPGATPTTTNP